MPVYQVTGTITTTDAIYIPQDAKSIIATNDPIKTKKLDDDLLDALEESYISFQDFLEEAHNTHITKAQKDQFLDLLEYNICDYNNADDSIDVFTTLTTHPEKQDQKDITILEITQRLRGQSKIEYNFFITLLDKYDVSEGFAI